MSGKRSRIGTNRHPTSGGRPWGWVETPKGEHVLYWSGARERDMAASRAAELDRVGWEYLGDDEREKVRHGAIGDCMLVHDARKNLGGARAQVAALRRELTIAREIEAACAERLERAKRAKEPREVVHG